MEVHYLKVILDTKGTILKIDCTLKDVAIASDEYIGKNWFETFIDASEKDRMFDVFKSILDANNRIWKLYYNEIRCPDNTYRYLDFLNTVKFIDEKKVIESFGVERFGS